MKMLESWEQNYFLEIILTSHDLHLHGGITQLILYYLTYQTIPLFCSGF